MLALFSLLDPHANIFAPQVFPTSSYIPSHKVQYFVETPSSNLLTSVSPYSEAMIVILSLVASTRCIVTSSGRCTSGYGEGFQKGSVVL